ncbi:KilA-N domain-containing protein, partial [Frateuria defendens]|uniref:KilA-N domain-containing protein n=1 Tax=Frateuria defendens TaxID=2219559 RepID=UPI00137935BF
GRYCLNDLHRAAGGEKRHSPSEWMKLDNTHELIDEISNSGFSPNKNPVQASRGRYGGTYVIDDLALTYAMWISPKFHLTVVRAFKETRKGHETDVGDAIVPAGSSLVSILEQALESERRRLELEAATASM